MLYRRKYQHDGTNLQDVMDGANYHGLVEPMYHQWSASPLQVLMMHRDIALALSTMICPFREAQKILLADLDL